jgi:hypothetical protein
LIDGIRWRIRVGSPWRDVPPVYGCWQTVYRLLRRWQRAAVWVLIIAALQAQADAAGLITWDVSVDSTINRAHQHAAGARTEGERQKQPPGGVGEPEPADHGLGRSRGGWNLRVPKVQWSAPTRSDRPRYKGDGWNGLQEFVRIP